MTIVSVGLDVPLSREFEYAAPDASAADIGSRVIVPFGPRTAVGVVLEVGEHSSVPADKLKPVTTWAESVAASSMNAVGNWP